MKINRKTIFLLALMLVFSISNTVFAQDQISRFAINLQTNVFVRQEEKSSNYNNLVTPGTELLYRFKSHQKFSPFVGFNYTYSYWHKEAGPKSEWRIKGHEMAVPILLEQDIDNRFVLKGGTYIGYLLKGTYEYKDNTPARKVWQDVLYQTNYSESPKFYFELYLDAMIKYDFDPWHTISFGPVIRYKIRDNWMAEVRPKILYGAMVQFRFWPYIKLKNND